MLRMFSLALLAATIGSVPCYAFTVVVDDFDGGADARVQSFSVDPFDGSPSFSSIFDVFGPTDRSVNFDFADDSVIGVGNPNEFETDTLGIAPFATYPEGNFFFGVMDLDNPDNVGGTGTATWTVDISGLQNLSLVIDFSAMGDFESTDNSHMFEASIDGGSTQTLMTIDGNDDIADFQYVMESGSIVLENDPLELTDDLGTRPIDNTFTTQGVAAISGTGSLLTLTYTAGVNNGGNEPFAFDNIVLTDEVAPAPDPDLDDDNDVDGADLVAIQRTNPQLIASWQSQFGQGIAATTSVPEPGAAVLLLTACGLARLRRKV